jgi:hypothetical protein
MERYIINGKPIFVNPYLRGLLMNSSDITEFVQAEQEIFTNLRLLSDIFSRTKLDRKVFIKELIQRVENELNVKLVYSGESKREG